MAGGVKGDNTHEQIKNAPQKKELAAKKRAQGIIAQHIQPGADF